MSNNEKLYYSMTSYLMKVFMAMNSDLDIVH